MRVRCGGFDRTCRRFQGTVLKLGLLNPWFGEPVVCTLEFRGFRNFRVSVISANLALNSLFVAVGVVFVVFVVFVISVVFVKGDPHANHRFGKP